MGTSHRGQFGWYCSSFSKNSLGSNTPRRPVFPPLPTLAPRRCHSFRRVVARSLFFQTCLVQGWTCIYHGWFLRALRKMREGTVSTQVWYFLASFFSGCDRLFVHYLGLIFVFASDVYEPWRLLSVAVVERRDHTDLRTLLGIQWSN